MATPAIEVADTGTLDLRSVARSDEEVNVRRFSSVGFGG